MAKTVKQTTRQAIEWDFIDWKTVLSHVRHIQERIFRLTREQNWSKVKNLQKLLVKSHNARLLAVRNVTQLNAGKATAGIDGKTYLTSKARDMLLEEIEKLNPLDYKCSPLKRVYIPKTNGDKRPLGIPTITDRIMQMLVKFALEPEWEARFEPNSYGFRAGRRAMDAISQIWQTIRPRGNKKTGEWILDADISKCFDNIDHEFLLQQVPVFQKTIKRWLKSGIIEFGTFKRTKAGTPQGGVISPLLANIALDGMERMFGIESKTGRYLTPAERHGINKGISLIRYADDFVVTARTREQITEYILPKLRMFLMERGMKLNEAKTHIVHKSDGFDFLGFNIRFYDRHRRICLVKPAKDRIQKHLLHIKDVLLHNRQAITLDIVKKLNPIIRGWANYYRYSNAKETFNYVDYRIWQMLWRWCLRRHPNKGKKWVRNKYFGIVDGRKWIFGAKDGLRLIFAAETPIRKYAKIKRYNSPFDPNLRAYWERRTRGKAEYCDW
jgi:RNA-directed DNA polymerase